MRAESGPIGGDMSHEFVILAETGESEVFCSRRVLDLPIPGEDTDFEADLSPIIGAWTEHYAATEEKHDEAAFAALSADEQVSARGIEVGHIFHFGTKYSAPMKATVAGPDGVERPVVMGSYGIGVSRLVGAVIEASHDDAGIIWPEAVAPFHVGIINLKPSDAATSEAAGAVHDRLTAAGIDVLLDDVETSAGAKFATMDLIGLPWQVIVGPKGIARGEVEVKNRATGAREAMSLDAAVNRLAGA